MEILTKVRRRPVLWWIASQSQVNLWQRPCRQLIVQINRANSIRLIKKPTTAHLLNWCQRCQLQKLVQISRQYVAQASLPISIAKRCPNLKNFLIANKKTMMIALPQILIKTIRTATIEILSWRGTLSMIFWSVTRKSHHRRRRSNNSNYDLWQIWTRSTYTGRSSLDRQNREPIHSLAT